MKEHPLVGAYMISLLPFELETREVVAYGLIGTLFFVFIVWLVTYRKRMKRLRARLSGSAEAKRGELVRRK